MTPSPHQGNWPSLTNFMQARYQSASDVSEELRFHSRRLFTTSLPNVPVDACQIDHSGKVTTFTIETPERLDEFIEACRKAELVGKAKTTGSSQRDTLATSTILCLYQPQSRFPLEITYEDFQKLLNYISPFPDIIELVKSFGEREGLSEEGWSGCYSQVQSLRAPSESALLSGNEQKTAAGHLIIESCYLFKHVELHHRDDPMDPWSIRQTGFYQKFDTNSRNSSSIIIEPSDVLRGRLGEVFGEGSSQAIRSDYPTHWTTFPLLCLSAVGGNWREYIRFLGIGIENIHTIFRFEQLGEKGTSRFTEVTFADLKRLEYFMDTGLRVAHVLNLNIEVMKAIQHDAERIRALEEKEANSERYTILAQAIDSKIREHNFLRKHIQSLCNRAERTSGMIRDAIALRDSATMKELARLANIETAQVHNLTEKTVKDTKAMKVLTFMAVIYLPASFTASFFGMDYVTVRTHAGGRISVHATENLWLYIAITAPLMVLTLGGLLLWEFLRKRNEGYRARREGKQGNCDV